MKAFPNPNLSNIQECSLDMLNNEKEYGMDLRDYFAGLAMQGIITGMAMNGTNNDGNYNFFVEEVLNDYFKSDRSIITRNAYQIADAMMESRK